MKNINDKSLIIDLLRNAKYVNATIEEYRIGERRDYYFDRHSNIYDDIMENIDDLSFPFDMENEDDYSNNLDALAYWTIYFEPNIGEDVDIALECGLTPFEYDDTFYLALSGCGMDLSPKLDAYVALTCGYIPSDSLFFNDEDYFKYVIGSKVYDKIIQKCTLESPKCTIKFSVQNYETKEESVC